MWFGVVAALVGGYSVYLGFWDYHYHCLPRAGFVYVIYGGVETVMSLWLVGHMGDHIQDLKMKRAIAYWDRYWESQRAKSN